MRKAASERLGTSSLKEYHEMQMKEAVVLACAFLMNLRNGTNVVLRHRRLCPSLMATQHSRLDKIISSRTSTISPSPTGGHLAGNRPFICPLTATYFIVKSI